MSLGITAFWPGSSQCHKIVFALSHQNMKKSTKKNMKEHSWNFIKIFLDARFIEYLIVFVMLRDLLGHRCDEYLPIFHTSEIINMRNLSTNFRPQNLSKLTIRKFHIWQIWRIGTNSSYRYEIYEMRNLRFNRGLKFVLKFLMLIISDVWRIGKYSSHLWRTGATFSRVWRIGTNSSHMWRIGTNSSHIRW